MSASSRHLRRFSDLYRDRRGAATVEFTLVMGLLFALTFGIAEGALMLWQWNSAEKATQLAVRYAVESDVVASGFTDYSGVVDGGLTPGTEVTGIAAFTVRCTNTGCSVIAGSAPGGFDGAARDAAAFDAVLTRAQSVFSRVEPANLVIDYAHVGLGFAGRPGLDIVPAVTVSLRDLEFELIATTAFIRFLALLAGDASEVSDVIAMPGFDATLIGEDLTSTGS